MPENDSQQNDSQQKQEQEMKELYFRVLGQKAAFQKVALNYGGRVRIASQHEMIWQGMGNAFKSHNKPDVWRGLCGVLATEWIKEHIRGGDLIENVIRFTRVLVHKSKWSEKDKLFVKNLNPTPVTYNLALSKFCKFEEDYHFDANFRKFSYIAFKRCKYQIIIVGSHTMASCVYANGKFWMYDPAVGEVRDISSAKFLEDYLNCAGVINSEMYVCEYAPRFNSLLDSDRMVYRRNSFS